MAGLTLGIIGGMGPGATNLLCDLITHLTPAEKDQDHIPVITFNNADIPSRVEAILGGGPSPLKEMIKTASILEAAGAQVLLMPCNLAHYYYEELLMHVKVPILNMIEETVSHLLRAQPSLALAGLLASTATIKAKLYHRPLSQRNIGLVVPDDCEQERLVMSAIYGQDGVKSGGTHLPQRHFEQAARSLLHQGAEVIICGCTEVSVALAGRSDLPLVDPLRILAERAVSLALGMDRNAIHAAKQVGDGPVVRDGTPYTVPCSTIDDPTCSNTGSRSSPWQTS